MTKKFNILINGKNFLINVDGRTSKHGFFTTRYVEANDESDAKKISIDLINKELGPVILNNSDDSPKFIFNDIRGVEDFGDCNVPGSGFTWYEES